MNQPIYLYGAGGLGREVRAMLQSSTQWRVAGFYDDNTSLESVDGIQCLKAIDSIRPTDAPVFVLLTVGRPQSKAKMADALAPYRNIQYPTLIHPAATVLDRASIRVGEGTVITPGCALTTNITLGIHVLINLNTTIGHDVVIGDRSSIMPGVNLAGNVRIGNDVLIGSGANILNGVHIGDSAIVGAGAVVTKNVAPGITVVGIPARRLGL